MPDTDKGAFSFVQKILAGVATGALTIGLVAVIAMTVGNSTTAGASAERVNGKLDNISDKISDIQKALPNFVTQDQFKQASSYRDLQLSTMQRQLDSDASRVTALEAAGRDHTDGK